MFGNRHYSCECTQNERRSPVKTRHARQQPAVRRAGMTLIEMLLALAVLGVLAALSWPSVLRIHREQKLVSSAEKVRALVAIARVNAIESGLSYQFRYETAGTHFLVVPFEKEFESVDPRTSGAGSAEGLGRFSKASNDLPKGMKFVASSLFSSTPNTSTSSGQQLSSEVLSGLPNADKLSGVSWSGPIVFQPDGSAADAEFSVHDDRGQYVTFRVRGLTGAVSMGRLQRGDHP